MKMVASLAHDTHQQSLFELKSTVHIRSMKHTAVFHPGNAQLLEFSGAAPTCACNACHLLKVTMKLTWMCI